MKIKYKLILPVLIATTACNNSNSVPISLTGETANAIKLLAGTRAVAKSDSEVLAVDYDKSAVGTTVTTASLNGLTNVTLKVVSPVGGDNALSITGTPAEQSPINMLVVSDNLNLYLQADIAMHDITGQDPETSIIPVNGTNVFMVASDKTLGTTEYQEGALTLESADKTGSVSGILKSVTVGTEKTNVYGYARMTDGVFTAPASGSYTYNGPTVVFSGENDFQTNTSTMTVNFVDQKGTYSADNFTASEGSPNLNIKLASDVTLNNSTGVISGSNGTIEVGGTSNAMELIGIMNINNNSVAGAVVVNDPSKSSKISGGVFGLAKK